MITIIIIVIQDLYSANSLRSALQLVHYNLKIFTGHFPQWAETHKIYSCFNVPHAK